MPKDIELAIEWIKERSALTDQGSGQITIGGRIYTKDNLIDLKDDVPGLGLTLTDKYKSDFKIIE